MRQRLSLPHRPTQSYEEVQRPELTQPDAAIVSRDGRRPTTIYSHISYGTLIWGSNYTSKLLPIHLLQKRAPRAITFTDRRTPSRPLFQRLDILNIFEIVKLQLSELAYKHITNQLPEVSYYYFRDISTVHSYETRSKTNKSLFLPRVNLNYGQFGVTYAAIKTWNETPNEIRASKSTKVFRKKYKDFLLSQ